MKSKFNIVGLRGSIFIPQIKFSWDIVNNLLNNLVNYIPLVNNTGGPIFANGQVMNPEEWSLSSSNNNSKLIFQAQKIDYIETMEYQYDNAYIIDFSNKCKDLFDVFLEKDEFKSTRIAIAPTFKYNGDYNEFMSFVNAIYNKNVFKGSSIHNCDFSQVYRVKENIGNKEIITNYLSKFYVTNNIITTNGVNQIQESLMLDLDINTKADPNIQFELKDIEDFFNQAPVFCDTFMSFYFQD